MAKLETLTDDFATQNATLWDGYNANVTATGGQLSIVPDNTFTRELASHNFYDLSASYVRVEIAALGSSQFVVLQLTDTGGTNYFMLFYENGLLKFREAVASVVNDTQITWDATAHKFWQIRETGGTIYWETSPDGTTWTVRRSKTFAVPQITSLYCVLVAYTTTGTSPALLDNINPYVAPPATPAALITSGTFRLDVDTLVPQNVHVLRDTNLVLVSVQPKVTVPLPPDPGPGEPPPVSPLYNITRTTYYVGIGGNDAANGLSHSTRWATWNRAMQQNYTAGDGLLFERGGTYSINAINKVPAANGAQRWIIGSYGTGAMPIMLHYKICNIRSSWTLHSAGIWKINLGSAATHTGMTELPGRVAYGRESNTNIGYVSVDGVIYGAKKTSIAACTTQWDFFGDTSGDWFYIKSSAHPLDLCADFRAAPDGRLIQLQNNMEMCDMEFTGCGGVVFSGASSTATNVKILRNTIRNVGGSFLIGYNGPPYTTRWGDGIEIWGGASNYEVANNTIIGSWDAAIIGGQGAGTLNNISMHHNFIYNSGMAVEFSIKQGDWNNIVYEYNEMYDTGTPFSWAGVLQPNQSRNAALIFMDVDFAHGASTNIFVRNNKVVRAQRYMMTWPVYDPPLPAGVVFTNNDIRMASGAEMQYTKETINNAAAYRTRTGREVGSVFTVL